MNVTYTGKTNYSGAVEHLFSPLLIRSVLAKLVNWAIHCGKIYISDRGNILFREVKLTIPKPHIQSKVVVINRIKKEELAEFIYYIKCSHTLMVHVP